MADTEPDWLRLLDRELYWRGEATADLQGATQDLRIRLERLAESLTEDLERGIPAHEPSLRQGRGWRRALKRSLFRLFRPVTRRNDRVAADLAGMSAELVDRLAQTQVALQRLDAELEASRARAEPANGAPRPVRGPSRWLFGETPEERIEALRRFEGVARDLRAGAGRAPLWLDLGCGRGELLRLLDEWGWRAIGVEEHPPAVEEAARSGARVVEAEPVRYLLGYEEEPPMAVSAIGLLEHLPVSTWADLLGGAQRVLRAGGALLVETLDPADRSGLRGFFADPTVTRLATRRAVRRLAEEAGFVEVVDLDLVEGAYAVLARV